jgi:hypothetical protein
MINFCPPGCPRRVTDLIRMRLLVVFGKIAARFNAPLAGGNRAACQAFPFIHDAESTENRPELLVLVTTCHGE